MQTVDSRCDSSPSALKLSASCVRNGNHGSFPINSTATDSRFSGGIIARALPLASIGKEDQGPMTAGESLVGTADAIPLWKRVFDVSCILLVAPFWTPLVFLIALWIKCVSPGSIFFCQERIGHRGKRFKMVKFRTMKPHTDTAIHERHLEQIIQANSRMAKLDAGDDRIIRGGRLLRASGLDELPQLWNILCGEMSLVGPRPCTVNEFRRYQPWQQERVNAAPGLTGYWQVNGKNKTTFTEMINLDIFYAKNMSLLLDCWIVLRTPVAILGQLVEARGRAGENATEAEDVVAGKKT